MKKHVVITSIVLTVLLVSVITAFASLGNTDSSNDPSSTLSYTLEDIYNRINGIKTSSKQAFTEPSVAPGVGSMYTLDQIYELIENRSHVRKTGQTTSFHSGDDGDLEKGASWPNPRFKTNKYRIDLFNTAPDGTVTDNLTGLVWLADMGCGGLSTWQNAIGAADTLADGQCNLKDESEAGDWRLPNVMEMLSMVDFSKTIPNLSGYPTYFSDFEANGYWTSTTVAESTSKAWVTTFGAGSAELMKKEKTELQYVWFVRDQE
jgi:hypothetical protein